MCGSEKERLDLVMSISILNMLGCGYTMETNSKFIPGQTLTTTRYIPPLPKGSTVTVMRVECREQVLEYLIVGHKGRGRSLVELWVSETDLKQQLVV